MKRRSREPDLSKRGTSRGSSLVYGLHAVRAAAANPARRCLALRAAREDLLDGINVAPATEVTITSHPAAGVGLPADAVHQGLVGYFSPLPVLDADELDAEACRPALLLDGVTDPRNVGSMLRGCAAFGFKSLIVQERHSPDFNSPALLKTSCGGAEMVALYRTVNLARLLRALREQEVLTVGLAAEATTALNTLELPASTLFVVGAEGEGLRRLVRENCDVTAKIKVRPGTGGLNAAVAASVAMYAYTNQHGNIV